MVAVDTDADAIDAAARNLAANGIADGVDLRQADIRTLRLSPGDILLANLTGALLAEHGALLGSKVRPRGHLIVSGFTLEDERDVTTALGRSATLIGREVEDEWVAACLEFGGNLTNP